MRQGGKLRCIEITPVTFPLTSRAGCRFFQTFQHRMPITISPLCTPASLSPSIMDCFPFLLHPLFPHTGTLREQSMEEALLHSIQVFLPRGRGKLPQSSLQWHRLSGVIMRGMAAISKAAGLASSFYFLCSL